MSEVYTVDQSKLWFSTYTLANGQYMVTCHQYDNFTVLGFVWGVVICTTDHTKCFQVHGSFTCEWCRRQGVRRAINRYLFEECGVDYVTTPDCTESGRAYMERLGYQRDLYGGWYIKREATHDHLDSAAAA